MSKPSAARDGPRTVTMRLQTPFATGSYLHSSLMRVAKQTLLPQLHAHYRQLAVEHIRRGVAAIRGQYEARLRELELRLTELEERARHHEADVAERVAAETQRLQADFDARVATQVEERLQAELTAWEARLQEEAPQYAEQFAGDLASAVRDFFRDHPLEEMGGDPPTVASPGA